MADTREVDRKVLGFYRARLDDGDIVHGIIDHQRFPSAMQDMVMRLKHPHIYVFIRDEEDAVITYEPCYGLVPWVNTHILTKPSARGRQLLEFNLSTGIWIIENTDYDVITIAVPEFLGLKHSMFLSAMGAVKRFDILGTKMFTMDRTQLEEAQERLTALKAKGAPVAQEAQG